MPIYEYQCAECGHKFDEIQKVDATPLTECPECVKPGLVKLVSAPSFRLKGKGWYETDFKKDNRRNLADDPGSVKSADAAQEPAAKSPDKSAAKSAENNAGKKSESGKSASSKPVSKPVGKGTGGDGGKSASPG